jgi:hypothetical protein
LATGFSGRRGDTTAAAGWLLTGAGTIFTRAFSTAPQAKGKTLSFMMLESLAGDRETSVKA